jgi:hypothetical protein
VFDATRSTMEELGREIGLCLRYYSVTFRGQRPNKLRLLGGEAADPMLLGVLNAALRFRSKRGGRSSASTPVAWRRSIAWAT